MTRINTCASCFQVLFAIFLTYIITPAVASGYEEITYKTIRTYDDFELRQYEPFIVAEVTVNGDFSDVGNSAFRLLFDYISGNNAPRTAIAMTRPVTQQPVNGEKIDMTTPVLQSSKGGRADDYVFSFVMPASYTLETIPMPLDNRIVIREVPEKTIAVRTYSGSWSESNYRKNETILMRSLASLGIRTIAEPVYARYNSPFSLWFMRRNESMVEIELVACSSCKA